MGTMYSFNTDYAKEYGVAEAVILQNIVFWVKKNKANQKHFHNGKYWTYNSVKAFQELFDFLTPKQIRRVLDNLEAGKAIEKDNFNASPYDRTLWYTLSDEIYAKEIDSNHLAKMPNEDDSLDKSHLPIWANGNDKTDKSHLPIWANGNDEKGKPIPDLKTDYKTPDLKTHTAPEEKSEEQNPVCEPPASTRELKELQKTIKEIIGETVGLPKLKELVHSSGIERIQHHLAHWHIHRQNQTKKGAGYFIRVVENDIPPQEPERKQYQTGNTIPQRDNFEQRQYTDEELERFYVDLT